MEAAEALQDEADECRGGTLANTLVAVFKQGIPKIRLRPALKRGLLLVLWRFCFQFPHKLHPGLQELLYLSGRMEQFHGYGVYELLWNTPLLFGFYRYGVLSWLCIWRCSAVGVPWETKLLFAYLRLTHF